MSNSKNVCLGLETPAPGQFTVTYQGFNPKLDRRITTALEAEGFKWHASGLNYMHCERDLVFDVPNQENG